MGPAERRIRDTVKAGMVLKTVPGRAPFKVDSIDSDRIVLLFGAEETRTILPWELWESIPAFLTGEAWVPIGTAYDVKGYRGLDRFCRRWITRAVGGYVASVLEQAGIVDVDVSRPSKVHLKDDWHQTS